MSVALAQCFEIGWHTAVSVTMSVGVDDADVRRSFEPSIRQERAIIGSILRDLGVQLALDDFGPDALFPVLKSRLADKNADYPSYVNLGFWLYYFLVLRKLEKGPTPGEAPALRRFEAEIRGSLEALPLHLQVAVENFLAVMRRADMTEGSLFHEWQQTHEFIVRSLRENALVSRRVFVVHGHDEASKWQLKNFLTKLGLDPIVLHEQDSAGMTIVEKFEHYARQCVFAFVLLTPDDPASPSAEPEMLRRARQNVILEMGWFLRHVGRRNVVLLNRGVDIPSDILGVIYLPFQQRVEEVGEEIRQRLTGAGLL